MKVVFFTDRSLHGTIVLKTLKERGVPVDAVFVEHPRTPVDGDKVRKYQRHLKRLGSCETVRALLEALGRRVVSKLRRTGFDDGFYSAHSGQVYRVETLNDPQCEALLAKIEPDVAVMGAARILRRHIIRIPKIGILNAHLGLLPKYRGNDVIPWAIYNGDPVGVTVHFIDEGVDTGGIVAQERLAITAGDTLDRLRARASRLAGELMAGVLHRVADGAPLQVMAQSVGEGKQYYRMPRHLREETERRLRRMAQGA